MGLFARLCLVFVASSSPVWRMGTWQVDTCEQQGTIMLKPSIKNELLSNKNKSAKMTRGLIAFLTSNLNWNVSTHKQQCSYQREEEPNLHLPQGGGDYYHSIYQWRPRVEATGQASVNAWAAIILQQIYICCKNPIPQQLWKCKTTTLTTRLKK